MSAKKTVSPKGGAKPPSRYGNLTLDQVSKVCRAFDLSVDLVPLPQPRDEIVQELNRRLWGAGRLLRDMQWSIGHGHCSMCQGEPTNGHFADCPLAAWLNADKGPGSSQQSATVANGENGGSTRTGVVVRATAPASYEKRPSKAARDTSAASLGEKSVPGSSLEVGT